MSVREGLAAVLMVMGTLACLLAAIGILKLPDVLTRMSATSKAATLGKGCLLLAVAAGFADISVVVRALATVLFVFLTAPVASHTIARAAYALGVPLWPATKDERKGTGAEKEIDSM